MKIFFIIGCVSAFLSVALGAFGAHGLEGKLSAHMLDIWRKAVQYQMFHSIGLIAVSFLMTKVGNTTSANLAGWFMVAGIVLFSGSLYILSVSDVKWLGAITPFGGVAFLISWAMLIVAAYKHW